MNMIYKSLIGIGAIATAIAVKKGVEHLHENIKKEIGKEIDGRNAMNMKDMQIKDREATLSRLCADGKVRVRSYDEFMKHLDDIKRNGDVEKREDKPNTLCVGNRTEHMTNEELAAWLQDTGFRKVKKKKVKRHG